MKDSLKINDLPRDKQDLIELIDFFWRKKLVILIITISCLVASIIYTSQLEDVYTAEAILINNSQTNDMSNIAARLSGFGAFSAFTGGNQTSSKSEIATAIMKSRDFYAKFFYDDLADIYATVGWDKGKNTLIYDNDLYNVETNSWLIKKPSIQQSHHHFLELYEMDTKDDGTLSFKVRHFSPYKAKSLLDSILKNLNSSIGQSDIEETQAAIDFLVERRSSTNLVGMREVIAKMIEEQTKTLMLANISNDYVYSVIDPAVISESPSGPNRMMIYYFALTIGFFVSLLYLLVTRFIFGKQ